MEQPVYKFPVPRKKRRSPLSTDSPFPIPIESISGLPASNLRWRCFKGRVIGSSVVIDENEDTILLYQMGFFGKGNFSRSGIDYQNGAENSSKKVQSMSKRRYVQHLNWKNGTLPVDDILLPVPKKTLSTESYEPKTSQNQTSPDCYEQPSFVHPLPNLGCDTIKDDADFEDTWSMDDSEATEAFWGQPSVSSVSDDKHLTQEDSNVATKTALAEEYSEKFCNPVFATDVTRTTCMQTSDCTESVVVNDDDGQYLVNYSSVDEPSSAATCSDEVIVSSNLSGNSMPDECPGISSAMELPVDERCRDADDDGDVYVMDDTENSDEDENVRLTRPVWNSVLKKDPFPVNEQLVLSLEEAFFLSYGLGCLVVSSDDDDAALMSLTDMWTKFCNISAKFPQQYTVYHYFRCKGWVPKTGLKFGTDYILYKKGPPFYHASFSVIVQLVDSDLANMLSSSSSTDVVSCWRSLAGLNRVTEQVAKELMICYVVKPPNSVGVDFNSPHCVSRLKVLEVIVRRWVSKKERENTEHLTIP